MLLGRITSGDSGVGDYNTTIISCITADISNVIGNNSIIIYDGVWNYGYNFWRSFIRTGYAVHRTGNHSFKVGRSSEGTWRGIIWLRGTGNGSISLIVRGRPPLIGEYTCASCGFLFHNGQRLTSLTNRLIVRYFTGINMVKGNFYWVGLYNTGLVHQTGSGNSPLVIHGSGWDWRCIRSRMHGQICPYATVSGCIPVISLIYIGTATSYRQGGRYNPFTDGLVVGQCSWQQWFRNLNYYSIAIFRTNNTVKCGRSSPFKIGCGIAAGNRVIGTIYSPVDYSPICVIR